MNKKNIVIFISIFIIVIAVSVLAFFNLNKNGNKESINEEKNSEIKNNNNILNINNIGNKNGDSSLNGEAMDKKDETICDKIGNIELKNSCKSIILIEKADKEADIKLCLGILADFIGRSDCFASALGIRSAWSACAQGSDKDVCLESLFINEAKSRKDSFICNSLDADSYKKCMNEF